MWGEDTVCRQKDGRKKRVPAKKDTLFIDRFT